MSSSKKRVFLPIAESPPSKKPRDTVIPWPSPVVIDLEGWEHPVEPLAQVSFDDNLSSLEPELPPYLNFDDIPEHFHTNAQHEAECNCPVCALWRWERFQRLKLCQAMRS